MAALYLPRRLLNFHNHTYTQKVTHTETAAFSAHICKLCMPMGQHLPLCQNAPWCPMKQAWQSSHQCSLPSCATTLATFDWWGFSKDFPPLLYKILGFGYLPKWLVSTRILLFLQFEEDSHWKMGYYLEISFLSCLCWNTMEYGIAPSQEENCLLAAQLQVHPVKDNVSLGL